MESAGRRLLLTFGASAAGAILLGGCSPETNVVAGLSVTDSGAALAVFNRCDSGLDGVVLYQNPGMNRAEQRGAPDARWDFAGEDSELTTLNFTEPGAGWTTTTAFEGVNPADSFSFSSFREDHGGNSTQVTFTAADLEGLDVGQVRYATGFDAETQTLTHSTVSLEQFRTEACDNAVV